MKVNIRGRHLIDITQAFHEYLERRLFFALERFGTLVKQVTIRLEDVNGPHGGSDVCCLVGATRDPLGHVFLKDLDSDLYFLIGRIAERTRWGADERWRSIERLFENRSEFSVIN